VTIGVILFGNAAVKQNYIQSLRCSGIAWVGANIKSDTIITFEKEPARLADVDEIAPTVVPLDEAICPLRKNRYCTFHDVVLSILLSIFPT
jgi:hypothetical protein